MRALIIIVGGLLFFSPVENQAPAHEHDLVRALRDDHRHQLAGRDVGCLGATEHKTGLRKVWDPKVPNYIPF
jgi:hypothetical protein